MAHRVMNKISAVLPKILGGPDDTCCCGGYQHIRGLKGDVVRVVVAAGWQLNKIMWLINFVHVGWLSFIRQGSISSKLLAVFAKYTAGLWCPLASNSERPHTFPKGRMLTVSFWILTGHVF